MFLLLLWGVGSARNSHKVFAINSQLCSNHFAAFPILSLISNFSSPFQLFLFFPITFSLSAQTFHFSSFIVHRSPFVSLPFVSHLSFSSAAYHLPPFIFHFIFFIFHHVCKKSKSNLFDHDAILALGMQNSWGCWPASCLLFLPVNDQFYAYVEEIIFTAEWRSG